MLTLASGGNGTNPGTQSQPWKTIQKAAVTIVAGDTVNVADGVEENTRVTINKSGTEPAPSLQFKYSSKLFVNRAILITAARLTG